jgi:aminodeoxyfutalosine synthase
MCAQTTQKVLIIGIDETTKIYSMASAEDQKPKMTTEEIITLIKDVKRIPIERDTSY